MNILILNWRDIKNPKAGGAEQVTFGHAKRWVEMGHTVTWFTSTFSGAPKREMLEGVTIVRMGTIPWVYLFAPFFYWMSSGKFDVVVDEIHGIPFFTPFFVRIPIVAFIHEIAGDIWDRTFPFPFNKIGKIVEHIYPNFYKNLQFWTDAESTKLELEKYGIFKSNCTTIPCPIDDGAIKYNGKKEKQPTFVFISRLVPMKGIEEVLSAFVLIHDLLPAAHLRIIGSGEDAYVKKLAHRVQESHIESSVTFFGKTSDEEKMKLLGSSHVLLHASVKEGWSLVVLEASYVGTPSVVYSVNGLRDVVKNGKTGIVTEINSPSEMAKQGVLLYRNRALYRRLQRNGKIWVRSIQWNDVAKQSMKILLRSTERHA